MSYLVVAYCVVWVVLGGYIWNLSSRLKRLEDKVRR
ncbi:hypothetical protein RsTz2092_08760 [Deferribacterales bacterium RsTz2092]